MGVEGLYKYINKNCHRAISNISIEELKGKYIIIDGMHHIYGELIYMRSKKKEIIREDGVNLSHIYGLINSLRYYLKYNIIPIFVFDGRASELKREKIEERKREKNKNIEKIKELEKIIEENKNKEDKEDKEDEDKEEKKKEIKRLEEEREKIYNRTIIMESVYINDWIKILKYLGLPVIRTEGEADNVCAMLMKKNNNIYGIMSDDTDMIMLGAPRILRKIPNNMFTVIENKILLEEINSRYSSMMKEERDKFGINNLVEIGIIMGTDYGKIETKIKYNNVEELFMEYIKNNMSVEIEEKDKELYDKIREYYITEVIEDKYKEFMENIKWKRPDLINLDKFLNEKKIQYQFIKKNVDNFKYLFKNMIYENKENKVNNKIIKTNWIKIN